MSMTSLAGMLLSLWIADPFGYSFNRQTNEKGEAEVVLTANQNLDALEVTVSGDRQTIKKNVPALRSGQTYKIRWVQNGTEAAYSIRIVGKDMDLEANFEISRPSASSRQSSASGGTLQVLSSRSDLLEKHEAAYRVPFDVESYEFTVFNNDGDTIFSDSGRGTAKAGERMALRWDSDDPVFLIKLSIVSPQGQTAEYALVPWSVEIPHTDVKFDSGKAVIRGDQAQYVEDAAVIAMHELAGLEKANKAVNANITAQLYIIGYTDTVGGAADNKKLSEARAKAIAEFFKQKGVWCEIFYAGMGESGLKVATGDNVDEERNRRAAYIMTNQTPGAGGAIPSGWKKAAEARMRPQGELPPYPEKYREERDRRKGGKGGSGGSSGSESDGSGADSYSSGSGSGSSDGPYGGSSTSSSASESSRGEDGPSAVGGTPGASSKGCSVDGGGGALGLLLGLGALLRRRRLR